jgi:membrane protein YqaA with SNARE-associated domain
MQLEMPMDEHPTGDRESAVTRLVESVLTRYVALEERLRGNRRAQLAVALGIMIVVLVPSLVLLFLPLWVDLGENRFKGLGYAGIFIANLVSTVTVVIPVPGLTAAGQALIVSGGKNLSPIPVGIVGGAGMALGEITAYITGAVGREIVRGRQVGGPARFRRAVEATVRWIGWLMAHYGMLTLFALSVIPNPLFEVAGLTAGSVRMKFWRFMLPVAVGKILRGLILAFLGAYSLGFLGL